MRDFLPTASRARWFTILLVISFALTGRMEGATNRNILLIVADDYGVDSSALYNTTNEGARLPPTPSLANLASNGVLFRKAYAYPTCSPTRSCIITGRYGFRTGIGRAIDSGPGEVSLPVSEFTLSEVLDANPQLGYRHAATGKWHLGQTNAADPNVLGGWSHFSGSFAGDLDKYTNWSKTVDGTNTPGYTPYATTDNVDDALAWTAAQGTNNWFLWLAFNAPHKPFHKPPDALHSYDFLTGTTANINAAPRPYFEAMVEAMDSEIGRLLTNISLTNTTVIFIGDNGTASEVIQPPFVTNRAKGTLYDGGIHVPLIIGGAGVNNPGRESAQLAHCVDLYATILELAGVNTQSLPAHLTYDSQSLLPALTGTIFTGSARMVLSEYFAPGSDPATAGRTIQGERYKLIQFRDDTYEFYDRDHDPQELTNLLAGAMNPAQQNAYDLLANQSDDWQSRPVLTPSISTNLYSVTFTPVQFFTYVRQRSTDLFETNWIGSVVTSAASSDSSITISTPIGPATNVFARVRVIMP
jgi:arylsulfatase A-like enzyme